MISPELADVVSRVLKIPADQVSRDLSQANTATWTSLGHLNLILHIEERCGIRFSSDEIPKLTSVGVIQDALDRRGGR